MRKLDNLTLSILVVAVSAMFAGCDVEEDGDGGAGGAIGGGGGSGGDGSGAAGGGSGADYKYIHIIDISAEENMAGTPGADICGIQATCGGNMLTGDDATLNAGSGTVCAAIDPPMCSAIRNEANASLDSGADCQASSAPSDYVSIGVTGSLVVEFGQDLRGCAISIIENNQGATPEGYEVHICADTTGMDCLTDEPIDTLPQGGNTNFDIPE